MRKSAAGCLDGAPDAHASADSLAVATADDKPPIATPLDGAIGTSAVRPHTLPAERVALQLATDARHGLTDADAEARLARNGPNAIRAARRPSLWGILLRQVANALTAVLIAVAALSFGIGDYIESSVVVAIIVLNIAVG